MIPTIEFDIFQFNYFIQLNFEPIYGAHIYNNEWQDSKSIFHLINLYKTLIQEKDLNILPFFILCSFLYKTNSQEIINIIQEIFEGLTQNKENEKYFSLIAYKTPEQNINSYTVTENVEISYQLYDEFYKTLKIYKIEIPVIKPLITEILKKLKYKSQINDFRKQWQRLYSSLSYNRSPFYQHKKHQYFKRGNQFDFRFRPIIETQNNHFDNHSKESMLRWQRAKDIQSNEPLSTVTYFKDCEKDHKLLLTIMNQQIIWSDDCHRQLIIQNENDIGMFYVTAKGYYYSAENKSVFIKNTKVQYLFWCWNDQIPQSIQIFTTNHKCYLFVFPKQKSHKFVSNLKKISLPNKIFFQENPPNIEIENLKLTQRWRNHQLSNFDYLIWLNLLSGRSFLDTRIYPVFPILLVDFDTKNLDFEDPKIYRDLSKNILYQNLTGLRTLNETIKCSGRNYLFSALYISTFLVALYLIRLEPFTSLHIKLQDGRFDVPSRLFFSIRGNVESTIRICKSIKEYIPEFYFDCEFLENSNNFDLGRDDKDVSISNVNLSNEWETPVEQIYNHICALESNYVRNNLNLWIDLIWGVKQSSAEDMNTFPPQVFPNVWSKIKSHTEESLVVEFLNSVGEIPQQLFTSPHPTSQKIKESEEQRIFFLQNIVAPVVQFKTLNNSFDDLKVYTVLQNNKLFCIRSASSYFEVNFKSKKLVVFPKTPKLISYLSDTSFAYAAENSLFLRVFDANTRSIIVSNNTPHLSTILCICSFENYIISGGEDSCIGLWKYKEKDLRINLINTLMVHHDAVIYCVASVEYGIVVTCSKDNSLVISTLPQLSLLRVIDLGFKQNIHVTDIIICHSMGTIVVIAEGNDKFYIKNYTVNGRPIGEIELDIKIIGAANAWNDKQFDYIGIVDQENRIVIYNAVTLKKKRFCGNVNRKITSIKFENEFCRFVVSTDDVSLVFVPANID